MWISEHCFPVGKDVLLYLKLSRRDKFERDLMGSAVDLWERSDTVTFSTLLQFVFWKKDNYNEIQTGSSS